MLGICKDRAAGSADPAGYLKFGVAGVTQRWVAVAEARFATVKNRIANGKTWQDGAARFTWQFIGPFPTMVGASFR